MGKIKKKMTKKYNPFHQWNCNETSENNLETNSKVPFQ